jgi:hypothetical protein
MRIDVKVVWYSRRIIFLTPLRSAYLTGDGAGRNAALNNSRTRDTGAYAPAPSLLRCPLAN